MAFWDGLYKEIGKSGIYNQTLDQREKIEGVLFDIWMKGQLERPPLISFGVIIFSGFGNFLFSVFSLPHMLARLLPSIAFSLIIAGLTYIAWFSLEIAFSIFLITLTFLKRVRVIEIIRNIIYDIFDAFCWGALTRRKIKVLQNMGPIKKFKGDTFLSHLFISRIITSGDFACEAEAFQEMVKVLKDDWPAFEKIISNYWSNSNHDRFYWRNKLKEIYSR